LKKTDSSFIAKSVEEANKKEESSEEVEPTVNFRSNLKKTDSKSSDDTIKKEETTKKQDVEPTVNFRSTLKKTDSKSSDETTKKEETTKKQDDEPTVNFRATLKKKTFFFGNKNC